MANSLSSKRSYLCLNNASTYNYGHLLLPPSFVLDHGDELPKKVYMHMPNRDIWRGIYVKDNTCIEGLETLMNFYSVKPYHLMLIHYLGGPDFDVEIFNPYAVEIAYPFKRLGNHQRGLIIDNRESLDSSITEVEMDKLCATLCFNALNKSREVYQFQVEKTHLERAEIYQVLRKEGCDHMGLEEQMDWIDFRLKKFKWRVNLIWDDGEVFFDRKWEKFTKAAGLSEGDTFVIEYTKHYRKFRVSVFEANKVSNYNNAGLQQGKSLMKFFKIVKHSNNDNLVLDVPKLFWNKYGKRLRKEVVLFVADGKKFCVKYCSLNKLFYNLQKLLKTYQIKENYVLFFDYVGNSTFYLSIFSSWCYDVCNQIEPKLLVTDIIGHTEEDLIEPKVEEVIELSDSNEEDIVEEELKEGLVQNNGSNAQVVQPDVLNGRNDFSFTVNLLRSHTDQQGHGVYFPRHLLSVYRPWNRSTVVILIYRGREWRVGLLRNKKMCRFGLGWNNFTGDNKFEVGRKLSFFYRGNMKFLVNYD